MSPLARLGGPAMTKEEFLEWSPQQRLPHELVDGRPVPLFVGFDEAGQLVAMAAATADHAQILGNAYTAVRQRAPRNCSVLVGGIAISTEAGIREPDLVLSCGVREPGVLEPPEPVLLGEVLSRHTANVDRGEKLEEYQALPAVQEVWLVDSSRRRVTVHSRDGEAWVARLAIGQGALPSRVLSSDIPLDELYEGVPV